MNISLPIVSRKRTLKSADHLVHILLLDYKRRHKTQHIRAGAQNDQPLFQCFFYNLANRAACAIATAVRAAKLAFLTDIEGVYRDPLDRTSLISELTIPEAKEFLKSGNVGGGMLPKLQNCIQAIESGVSRVHILDGRIEHCLLLEFFTNKGIGTAIIGDGEEPFFNEQ